MKKTQLLLTFCFAGLCAISQPYGEKLYSHPSSFLSAGAPTRATPGFLMAGNMFSGTPNFFVDKTNVAGTIGGGTSFSRNYIVLNGAPGCIGGLSPIPACQGVSIMESGMPSGAIEK